MAIQIRWISPSCQGCIPNHPIVKTENQINCCYLDDSKATIVAQFGLGESRETVA